MEILTNLTWDYMQKELDNILSQNEDYYILDWALLPIVKYFDMCDIKILISSDDIVRKERILNIQGAFSYNRLGQQALQQNAENG